MRLIGLKLSAEIYVSPKQLNDSEVPTILVIIYRNLRLFSVSIVLILSDYFVSVQVGIFGYFRCSIPEHFGYFQRFRTEVSTEFSLWLNFLKKEMRKRTRNQHNNKSETEKSEDFSIYGRCKLFLFIFLQNYLSFLTLPKFKINTCACSVCANFSFCIEMKSK